MHKRIQDTKQYMIQLTDNQLELTTKRTIMENEQMTAEVAYQSHQTSAVIAQNKVLDGRIAELRRALALSRETENELAKRNTVYQSTIKQLVCFQPRLSTFRGLKLQFTAFNQLQTRDALEMLCCTGGPFAADKSCSVFRVDSDRNESLTFLNILFISVRGHTHHL